MDDKNMVQITHFYLQFVCQIFQPLSIYTSIDTSGSNCMNRYSSRFGNKFYVFSF